jgi:hypothetical protein
MGQAPNEMVRELAHGRHTLATRCPLSHFHEHGAGSSMDGMEHISCQLRADLGLEPKIKVEAHEQLYTFHIVVKVIRALD